MSQVIRTTTNNLFTTVYFNLLETKIHDFLTSDTYQPMDQQLQVAEQSKRGQLVVILIKDEELAK